jgi:hypothetical protein
MLPTKKRNGVNKNHYHHFHHEWMEFCSIMSFQFHIQPIGNFTSFYVPCPMNPKVQTNIQKGSACATTMDAAKSPHL